MKRALIFPSVSVGYYLLSLIFALPGVEHVLAFLILVTIVTIVSVHKVKAYDGTIEVETDPGGVKRVSFVVPGDPETLLLNKTQVSFVVKKENSQ